MQKKKLTHVRLHASQHKDTNVQMSKNGQMGKWANTGPWKSSPSARLYGTPTVASWCGAQA
jgi:hypothetical protein